MKKMFVPLLSLLLLLASADSCFARPEGAPPRGERFGQTGNPPPPPLDEDGNPMPPPDGFGMDTRRRSMNPPPPPPPDEDGNPMPPPDKGGNESDDDYED